MVKKKTKVKVKRNKVSRPFGIAKVGKGYQLAFGSKTKPRLGSKKFKTTKSIRAYAKKVYKIGA